MSRLSEIRHSVEVLLIPRLRLFPLPKASASWRRLRPTPTTPAPTPTTRSAAIVCGMLVAGFTCAVITGLASGNLGQVLRAGFLSAVTVFAMNAVGDALSGLGQGMAGGGGYDAPMKLGGPTELPEIIVHAPNGTRNVVTASWYGAAQAGTGSGTASLLSGYGYGLLQGAGSVAVGYLSGTYDWASRIGRDVQELGTRFYQRPLDTLHSAIGPFPGGGTLAGGLKLASAGIVGLSAGYRSFSAFKYAQGSAGPGMHWHHIVEQTPGNIARFGENSIHTSDNLVRMEAGAHQAISAFYSSTRFDVTGTRELTVRGWLSSQSFEAQMEFGRKILRDGVP